MDLIEYLKRLNGDDVFKLFIEMQPALLTEDRYDGSYSGGRWLCSHTTLCPEEILDRGPQSDDGTAMTYWADKTNDLIVAADTPQQAICLAWLKWKEGEK